MVKLCISAATLANTTSYYFQRCETLLRASAYASVLAFNQCITLTFETVLHTKLEKPLVGTDGVASTYIHPLISLTIPLSPKAQHLQSLHFQSLELLCDHCCSQRFLLCMVASLFRFWPETHTDVHVNVRTPFCLNTTILIHAVTSFMPKDDQATSVPPISDLCLLNHSASAARAPLTLYAPILGTYTDSQRRRGQPASSNGKLCA
jgi:hypothetical protein